ncbi:MAG: hypothetical protein GY851_33805 [bacterium]|nr:hypothetical protein [bacterium]
MGWPNDVSTKWPAPNNDELKRAYWEVNFMCHLLDFGKYEHMYTTAVSAVMEEFKKQIRLLPDDVLNPSARQGVEAELDGLKRFFEGPQYENVQMRHLYTREILLTTDEVVQRFDRIGTIVANDTQTSVGGACSVCMPFLRILANPGADPVNRRIMQDHIDILGKYSLRELYAKPKREMPRDERTAIRVAKKKGILSSKRPGNTVSIFELKNGRKCVNYHCTDGAPDDFCVEGDDGTCSSMSD